MDDAQPTDDDSSRMPRRRRPHSDEIDDQAHIDAEDATPIFLSPGNDAVEVQVDDDDMPMEEDDDDDDDDNDDDAAAMNDDNDAIMKGAAIVDMSLIQLESHTGPVYAVATHFDATTKKLVIVSAGGDDKSFLHQVVSSSSSASMSDNLAAAAEARAATTTTTTTKPSASSVPLEYAHTDSVSCAALNLPFVSSDLSKTPRLAAVGGYDGAIVVYKYPDHDDDDHDHNDAPILTIFEGPSDVEWLCFHPVGGTVLLVGSASDGTVWMYHVPLKKCLQVFVGHESAVTAGSFSPDGRWALSCSSDGTLRIWAPKTGMSKHVFRFGSNDGGAAGTAGTAGAGLTCMGTNGGMDGQLVIVGSEDGQAHVCHIGTKKVVASLRHFEMPQNYSEDDEIELPASVEAVAFASQAVNPNWCATGGVDGVLKVWDLANNGQCRQVCKYAAEGSIDSDDENKTGGITRIQWHPTLPLILASYTNGVLRLWDARNGQLVHTLTGGSLEVLNDLSVQWVDSGKSAIIVTASDDGKVRVFEINISSILDASTTLAAAAAAAAASS